MNHLKSKIGRGVFSDGVWVLSGRMLSAICGIAVNALVTRILEPEAVGAYFITVSIVGTIAVLSQLGLAQVGVRIIAVAVTKENAGRSANIVRVSLHVVIVSSLFIAICLVSGLGGWLAKFVFESRLLANTVYLLAALSIFSGIQGLLAELFRGFGDIRLATLFEGTLSSFLNAFVFGLLWWFQGNGSLEQVLILSIAAGVANTLLGIALIGKHYRNYDPTQKINISELLNQAWPFWVTNLTTFVLMQADLWLIGMFQAHEQVAMYGAAFRLVKLVIFPLAIVNAVIAPRIAALYCQGEIKAMQNVLRSAATLASIPAIPVLIVFVFYSGPVLSLVYGEYYRDAAQLLIILSIGQIVSVWTGSCVVALNMTKYEKSMMLIGVGFGCSGVIFAYLVVEPYGTIGVAIVAASTLALRNVFTLLYVKRHLNVWTYSSFSAFPIWLGRRKAL